MSMAPVAGQAADRRLDRLAARPGSGRRSSASTRRFSPKPGQRNLPSSSWRNQLTWKIFGGCFSARPIVQPVAEVVAHVVAAEGQHGHRIAAHDADRAALRRGRLRRHRRADEDAVLPVERLEDERRRARAAAAEDDRRDRHALRVLELAARSTGTGCAGAVKREFGCAAFSRRALASTALPRQSVRRSGTSPSLPSHHGLPSSVTATLVKIVFARRRRHRVRVRLRRRARRDAEEAGLGVDRPQPAVGAEPHPGDVVADRPDLPALLRRRRHEHGEVGLAAGARERGGDVVRLALRALDAEDQHVLGEPALLARLRRWRCAARSTSCRAARCRRSRSRRSRSACSSGKCRMKRRSGLRSPCECRPFTNSAALAELRRAPRSPMRVMMRMLATT